MKNLSWLKEHLATDAHWSSPLVGEDSHREAMTDEGCRREPSKHGALTPHLRSQASAVLSHKGRGR